MRFCRWKPNANGKVKGREPRLPGLPGSAVARQSGGRRRQVEQLHAPQTRQRLGTGWEGARAGLGGPESSLTFTMLSSGGSLHRSAVGATTIQPLVQWWPGHDTIPGSGLDGPTEGSPDVDMTIRLLAGRIKAAFATSPRLLAFLRLYLRQALCLYA